MLKLIMLREVKIFMKNSQALSKKENLDKLNK